MNDEPITAEDKLRRIRELLKQVEEGIRQCRSDLRGEKNE